MQVSPQCSPQTTRWGRYANEIRGIGVSEIVFGLICLSVNIAALVYNYYWFPYNDEYNYHYYHNESHNDDYHYHHNVSSYSWVMAGIWGGIIVIITGSLGTAYPNRMTKSALDANLAMSIFSTLASATIVAMEIIAAICPVMAEYHDSWGLYYGYYCYTNALLASLHGATAGFGFICFCLGISHSAYCCKISCGGDSTSHTQALMMQEINEQIQPVQGTNGQIQPIQGINGQIQPIQVYSGQIQPIQVYSGQNQPVYQIPIQFNPYVLPPTQQNQPTTSAIVSDGHVAYTNPLMQAEVSIPGLIQEPAPTTSATTDA